jgi:mycothiol synthase
MAIRARPYRDDDLLPVQHALSSWIHDAGALGYCHVGEIPHRIYENLRGRRPVGDLVQVWEDGPAIVGIAINLRFGRAFDVFASPSLRGTDAELVMLRSAYETTLRHVVGDDRTVITDVWAGDEARSGLLARLVPLRGAREAGLRARARGRRRLTRRSDRGARRRLDRRVNRTGHFEPIATLGEFRRRGLARAAMLDGLRRMRTRGMQTATVEYDAGNAAARELYAALGFRRRFEIIGYRRP